MNALKRTGALALALTLALGCLSGCGQKAGASSSSSASSSASSSSASSSSAASAPEVDLASVTDPYLACAGVDADTVVATAGDVEITAGALLYWVAANADSLSSYYGISDLPWDTEVEGRTLAGSLKESALNTSVLYSILPVVAAGEELELSDEFHEEFDSVMDNMSSELGSEELRDHYLWQLPLTPEIYRSLYSAESYNELLREKFYGKDSADYPDDAEIISFLVDDQECYFFKHILFQVTETTAEDGTVTSNDEEQKAKAVEVLSQLRSSSDPVALFDELMNEYSEDPGLATFPEGYLGTPKDDAVAGSVMVPAVEEACLEMEDYEISDVLENDGSYHGYHIVMRLPVEGNADPAEYRDTYISYLMSQRQAKWLEEYPVTTTEAYDSIDPGAFYATLNALRTAVNDEFTALDAADSSASSPASSSSAG